MLRGLFGSRSLTPDKRQQILGYLAMEHQLHALQDDEAGRYNQALTMHGAGLAPGSEAVRAVAVAASRMAVVNGDLVQRHSNIGPIPDEAAASYMAWHLEYLALAEWSEAAAAAYQGIAEGATPFMWRVQQLLQDEERQRKRAMKEETALMKRVKLTAEEARALFV